MPSTAHRFADWLTLSPTQQVAAIRAVDVPTDPDDLAYGEDDAHADVAAALVEADEVAELVAHVAGSAALLSWIAQQELPIYLRGSFRVLDSKVRQLSRMTDERMEKTA